MAVLITTGDIKEPYEIMDAIFALDFHKESFFGGSADPAKAFDKAKEKLRTVCKNMGGDAVINCQFEYRVAVAEGMLGHKQVMEIFAYGTAVKLISLQNKSSASIGIGKKTNCTKCHCEMPSEAGFCPECGTKI